MGASFTGRNALLGGVVLAFYPALTAAALYPLPWVFAVLAPLSYGAEAALPARAAERLGRLQLPATLRFLMREMAAVLLLARTAGADSTWFALLAGGLFLFHWTRAAHSGLATYLNRCHNLKPVDTRNVDVAFPPAPPETLVNWRGARLLYLDALPVATAAFGALTGNDWLGAAGAGAALALEAAAVLALSVHVRRAAPLADRRGVIAAVDERVRAYRPEVLLYFSGPADSAYQATMWLGPLERISARALVVLRERELLGALGETTLPVLCIPSAVDMMNFRGLDTARVALFASNVGNNIHMLRTPGVVSVFIGHGDSDKEASFNPFTKVYDEVWVAGPAGRDRYRRAGVGVRDEAIVEVGRPQLAGVRRTGPGLPYPSVLYAPTWEGWTDDLFHTSVITMGPALVRELLALGVRVIYKPHPLTGHRSAAARRAHAAIMRTLRDAGDGAVPHLAVTGDEPHLYECFNRADLLISDISSVIADFLASGKPYAVTNVAGLPEREFRERYPTAAAAYLIGPDRAELPGVVSRIRPEEDVLAEARRELRGHLLGPDHPDALTRFDEAVTAARARAGGGEAAAAAGRSLATAGDEVA
ncbi:CDP-glycerol glycerophosphotransferase family protein [Microtetraspora niveoalba]|uniref:CDP-glycerol glycerophosphotransferase family protein n=1 Tax=Microtetraspora niveoalba TaxID=46175 RepID=UPI00082EF6D4|nr:CDP-glycerol glycerophosphotransferase family protein [Microtetraspora niveoalba]